MGNVQVQILAEVHVGSSNSPVKLSNSQDSHSPSLAEATISENESITLSGLTTPDTPRPSHPAHSPRYTPLTEDSPCTPEYRKLTPSPSTYENLPPRDRLSFQGDCMRPYENLPDRLSFQGILKGGDLGMCEKYPLGDGGEVQYENLNLEVEEFTRIDCNITEEVMDAIMSDSKLKEEEVKYEEIKESSIYESVDDQKRNFYENFRAPLDDDSEIYEPVLQKGSSYEEIYARECLISDQNQVGVVSSSGSLISSVEANKENEYECLVVDSSPDDSKVPDPNHNLPFSHFKPASNPEENLYEDVQVSLIKIVMHPMIVLTFL